MNANDTPFLGFWARLPRPFFVLAPLANVTDAVFRAHIVEHSRPHVFWTEFVAADGLVHPKGRIALLRDLSFSEAERPIVAQLFTSHPEHMREAAKLVKELGFDGVDINMGCPDKNVMKQGAGAACMKDPGLAQAIIRAAMEGVREDGSEPIPVSVKTRLGFNQDELETWLPKVLETKPAALTLHLRTKKEMSLVPAHWDRMARAVAIRDEQNPETLIIGNGDVRTIADGERKCAETGCDGVMFGRAIFGNPWLFDSDVRITAEMRIRSAVEHTKRFESVWGKEKSFELMKKHYQAYINHFPLAKELRKELMDCHSAAEVEARATAFLGGHPDIGSLSVIPEPKF